VPGHVGLIDQHDVTGPQRKKGPRRGFGAGGSAERHHAELVQVLRHDRPAVVGECADRSLLSRIDLYQLHRIDPTAPLADQIGALRRLQDVGKVRHVGRERPTEWWALG